MTCKTRKSVPGAIVLASMALFLFVIFSPVHAIATTEIEVNPVNTPDGAVILIVDGLGASYIYPELIPYAIDGTVLDKTAVHNISLIAENSSRVLDISAPQTYTEAGHSVLVTGNSGADGDMVGYSGATIYDAVHENGYLCFAVLEKGDFSQMRAEQDVVIYDETNSINNPTIKIETNEHSQDTDLVQGVSDLMNVCGEQAYDYVNRYPEGSGERYDAYNRWAIDTAADIIGYMSDNAPDHRYILTVNTGAVDSAGHYRRNGGYIENIEGIDSVIIPFYELCIENNIAFIFVSDHGMAFAANDVRGGHQSEKYAVTPEAQKIPLIIHAPDVDRGLLTGVYGQEDIAPTVLNILNLPVELAHADGSTIPIKDYVNMKIDVPPESTVELLLEDRTVASASHDSQYLFLGIEPGETYTVRIGSNEMLQEVNGAGKTVVENGFLEHEVFMTTDVALTFAKQISSHTTEKDAFLRHPRHLIGCVLIALINLTGLMIIYRILKEE